MKRFNKEAIVMLALPRWDGKYASTSHALAQELAKERKVFYVDNPFTVKDVFTKLRSRQVRSRIWALLFGIRKFRQNREQGNLVYVTPRMVIPINFLSPGTWYNGWSRINDRIVYQAIRSLLSTFAVRDFIFINSYNPFYGHAFPKASFRPRLTIYHCVDDISESKYVAKHGTRLEQEMIEKSDLTLATSKELVTLKKQYSDTVFYLPNAAGFSHFQAYLKGTKESDHSLDFINRDTKVIGYIGNICDRIDYDLLQRVLERHRDKSFLFVGPISTQEVDKRGIKDLPNTVFAGPQKMAELPRYLDAMDCTIIPFKLNKLTASIYPLKINEYLSMGKPVVSTPFSEDIYQFAPYISLSDSTEAFANAIDTELEEDRADKREQRIAVASLNTWENRVKEFWSIISEWEMKTSKVGKG